MVVARCAVAAAAAAAAAALGLLTPHAALAAPQGAEVTALPGWDKPLPSRTFSGMLESTKGGQKARGGGRGREQGAVKERGEAGAARLPSLRTASRIRTKADKAALPSPAPQLQGYHVHYVLMEAEMDTPEEAPLIVWFNGACAAHRERGRPARSKQSKRTLPTLAPRTCAPPAPHLANGWDRYLYGAADSPPRLSPARALHGAALPEGGPGASSLFGVFVELGPLVLSDESLKTAAYNATGVPTPQYNPHAWTRVGNVLAFSSPPPVGYSYCDAGGVTGGGRSCGPWDDETTAEVNKGALEAFFGAYPEYAKRPTFITGEVRRAVPCSAVPCPAVPAKKRRPPADHARVGAALTRLLPLALSAVVRGRVCAHAG